MQPEWMKFLTAPDSVASLAKEVICFAAKEGIATNEIVASSTINS
jgi:hypothetical protein